MVPGERAILKTLSIAGGIMGDTLTDPISWVSFGIHGLGPSSIKAAMALRAGKLLAEGETAARLAKAGATAEAVLPTVKNFIRNRWDVELGEDLLVGGWFMDNHAEKLAQTGDDLEQLGLGLGDCREAHAGVPLRAARAGGDRGSVHVHGLPPAEGCQHARPFPHDCGPEGSGLPGQQ